MTKKTWNRYWPDEIATLRRMHAEGASREDMALTLRRDTHGVSNKCRELGLPTHNGATTWTPARIAELSRLWDEELSGQAIGTAMGLPKNAVIGKARRLGLKPRPSPIVRRAKAAAPPKMASEPRRLGRPPKEGDNCRMACRAPDGPCEPQESAERPCQWPLWGDGPPTREFCGRHQRRLGDGWSPYCPEHHARAYAGKPAADKAA